MRKALEHSPPPIFLGTAPVQWYSGDFLHFPFCPRQLTSQQIQKGPAKRLDSRGEGKERRALCFLAKCVDALCLHFCYIPLTPLYPRHLSRTPPWLQPISISGEPRARALVLWATDSRVVLLRAGWFPTAPLIAGGHCPNSLAASAEAHRSWTDPFSAPTQIKDTLRHPAPRPVSLASAGPHFTQAARGLIFGFGGPSLSLKSGVHPYLACDLGQDVFLCLVFQDWPKDYY